MTYNQNEFKTLVEKLPQFTIKILFSVTDLKDIILQKETFWESVASVKGFDEEIDPAEKNECVAVVMRTRGIYGENEKVAYNGFSIWISRPEKLLYGAWYYPQFPIQYFEKNETGEGYEHVPSVEEPLMNMFNFIEETLKELGLKIR